MNAMLVQRLVAYKLAQSYKIDPVSAAMQLMKAYNLYEKEGKPIIIGGSTFAKSMKNIVAYRLIFKERENTAHEANENMAIENLMKCSKIYANALYQMSCN